MKRREGMSATRANKTCGRKFRKGMDEGGVSAQDIDRAATEALRRMGKLRRGRVSHYEAMADATWSGQVVAAVGYD